MNNFNKFFFLTAVYFVTGKLGLLMAVPPGYATAIWPPSGFALAGILILGNRFWPSVWLGSFLVNAATSLVPGGLEVVVQSLAPAMVIAFGASLQAVVGATLIKKTFGYPLSLMKEKEVFQFLFLVGPVSCLLNPTIGALTLIYSGVIHAESVFSSWWTWWVGDSIGVMIFAPVVLIFFAEPKDEWRSRKMTVALPMMLTFVLMTVLFIFLRGSEEKRVRDDFEGQAQLMTTTIENHIQRYLDILYFMQSFYNSSQEVERDEFAKFVSNTLVRHPGIIALEWNPKVMRQERFAFEAKIRDEGYPDFEIKELGLNQQIQKATLRDVYFPITFVEPMKKNMSTFGFDFMSEESRQAALNIAWYSGGLALTEPIHLLQGSVGAIAFLGIYDNNQNLITQQNRIDHLKGFIGEVLWIEEIAMEALNDFTERNFVVHLSDLRKESQEKTIFVRSLDLKNKSTINLGAIQKAAHGLVWEKLLNIGGRDWRIRIYPMSDYFIAQKGWSMWFVLASGLLFVGFWGGFLIVISGREMLVRRLVIEGTQELNQANEQLFQGMKHQKALAQSLEARNKEMGEARLAALNIAQDEQDARKRAQEAEQQLISAMSAKSEFTSIVSHELRTPLTVIKESISIVHDETAGTINADQKDFLETAKRNVDRLTRLINDVLDYQKLEGHHMPFQMDEQDINDVVREVGSSFVLPLKSKGLTLQIETQPDLPKIFFDRDRIIQVLTNLLSNAMKFTDQGQITIITEKEDDAVKVSVKDQGIGIRQNDFLKLFQSFSQISSGLGRQTGGTGLGLVLCKKIVEAHHGHVGVDSTFGHGTTFYFFLPIEKGEKV